MNKRLTQVFPMCRKGAGRAMLSLVLSALFLLSVFPAYALQKGGATTVRHQSTPGMMNPALRTWKVVASPNIGTDTNGFNGVAVVSTTDVWAVGSYINSSVNRNQTLTQHWNGSSWRVISSPNVGTNYNYLTAVAVVSAQDVWAVGDSQNASTSLDQTLIEHWNGSTWRIVSSPNVGTSTNDLLGVAVVSASDIWAVGESYNTSARADQTLTLHWNGSSWGVVSSPNAGKHLNFLKAVAVVSAQDVWAVGDFFNTATLTDQTLILHWNGTSWRVVSSPNVGTTFDHLYGVAVVSASDIWAVGNHDTSTSLGRTLTLHWDGTSWRVVSSPNVEPTFNILSGVAVVSASDVWAIGTHNTSTNSNGLTLTQHWDGSSWHVVSSPNVGTSENDLTGVAAGSAGDVWAVGAYFKSSLSVYQTLTEHFS